MACKEEEIFVENLQIDKKVKLSPKKIHQKNILINLINSQRLTLLTLILILILKQIQRMKLNNL